MESNTEFVNSYLELKALHEVAKIICDHIADANADMADRVMENITNDRLSGGQLQSTNLLEEMSKAHGGELPAAHEILEHYCRVHMRALLARKEDDLQKVFEKTVGEKYDMAKANMYCDAAQAVAECLIRYHDTGSWF